MVEIHVHKLGCSIQRKKKRASLAHLTDSATGTHFTFENMSSSLLKHKQLEAFGPPTNGSYEGIKVKNRIL